VIFKYLYFTR